MNIIERKHFAAQLRKFGGQVVGQLGPDSVEDDKFSAIILPLFDQLDRPETTDEEIASQLEAFNQLAVEFEQSGHPSQMRAAELIRKFIEELTGNPQPS